MASKEKNVNGFSPSDSENRRDQGKKGDGSGDGADYRLFLFIRSRTANSEKAILNIQKICQEYLDGRYELSVIDVYQNPDLTSEYQVIAVPTLLKVSPEPMRRVIGDLSEMSKVLSALDIPVKNQ